MTIREQQTAFVRNVATLIIKAYELGYTLTFGECFRTDEQAEINALGWIARGRLAAIIKGAFPALAEKIVNNGKAGGIRTSLHVDRLAIDFNLFRDGVWLHLTEDFKPLGEFWESLDPLNCWGGRFGDGNHFSMTWQGRK